MIKSTTLVGREVVLEENLRNVSIVMFLMQIRRVSDNGKMVDRSLVKKNLDVRMCLFLRTVSKSVPLAAYSNVADSRPADKIAATSKKQSI